MLDKTPLKSKKFMAYLISEITTKAGMFYMLMHLQSKLDWEELALLVAMLVSSSALTIGYVLGVAALEKYLHSAVEILDKDDKGKKDDQEES
tara:strand:+ start:6701 stop:6976 length:276 start_codon:yes stop_codon:yes gene_type:complete